MGGLNKNELDHISGISFQRDGHVVTTPERARIVNLDDIPSPFLEGILPYRDQYGKAIYAVVLMETNRGCPYKCAFCYWGGAIGQKVRAFSRERLREELNLFAREGVEIWRFQFAVAVTARRPGSMVVGQENEQIWTTERGHGRDGH